MSVSISDIITKYNHSNYLMIVRNSLFLRRKLDPMYAYILTGHFNVIELYDVDEHGNETHISYNYA